MSQHSYEAERYELSAKPAYQFELDRRDFFRLVGAGLVVVLFADCVDAQQERGPRGGGALRDIGAWLHIGEDGRVSAFTGKTEVGQNIRTSLTQAVAEELRVPPDSVTMVMADTQLTPYDAGTFGSRTTPDMNRQLRRAAAAARESLIDLAAQKWSVDRAGLTAAGGEITRNDNGNTLTYAELTKGMKLAQAVSDSAPVSQSDKWVVAGRSIPKVNGRAYVTGAHKYTSDMKLPGMLHGRILRPPAYGAALNSLDVKPAESIPGVVVVRDGEFVGVAAPSQYLAARALDSLKASWKPGQNVSDRDLFDQLRKPGAEGLGGGRGGGPQRTGNVQQAMESADIRVKATYPIAYIAHAPLEPRAAVTQWEGDKLTVWTGTQRPFGVRSELASAFRIPESNVRVIVPDTGSGYGGKHSGEAAVEAARLAKSAEKPVKLIWTREEEFCWAYARPAGVIDVSAGAMKDGTLTAWEFHNYNSGGSGIRGLYEIPNQHIEFHRSNSPLRQGSYRGLAATANHFARECHMDELAHALKMDPLEFRLKNLKDERQRAVLKAAAESFGWGKKPSGGRGHGIACGFEKGGYVATCAEVQVDSSNGRVKVTRAVTAFECGAVVNPEHLKNQIEGAVVQGLGGALFEALAFENGMVTNPRFSKYRVPRFSDTPKLETILLDRKDLPSAGAGETPIVGIAPAVGNAIFAATGVRLRSLPMLPSGALKLS